MLRINEDFDARLVKLASKRVKLESSDGEGREIASDVVQVIVLRHEDTSGGAQIFLEALADMGGTQTAHLFRHPVPWVSTALPQSVEMAINFDEVEFEGRLVSVKVKQMERKCLTVFTYDLVFECQKLPEGFRIYLDAKEENVDGKMAPIFYNCSLESVDD